MKETLASAFREMIDPTPTPTRFEDEWREYFDQYAAFDHVRYIMAIELPHKDYVGRDYRFHHLYDSDSLIHKMAIYKLNDIRIPLLFHTDLPFEEQWPYDRPGWISSAAQIETPVWHIHPADMRLQRASIAAPGEQRSLAPSFIRGIIPGGRG